MTHPTPDIVEQKNVLAALREALAKIRALTIQSAGTNEPKPLRALQEIWEMANAALASPVTPAGDAAPPLPSGGEKDISVPFDLFKTLYHEGFEELHPDTARQAKALIERRERALTSTEKQGGEH